MSSLHHWLVALGRGLKRDTHKRLDAPRPPLANAFVRLASTLSERQVWALGRLASRVAGLDLAERRDAL